MSASAAPRAPARSFALAFALVLAAGAALRFATLSAQSLWYDEAVTARLLRMPLGAMLDAIPGSESTPPLYYVVAWPWTHVVGTGEAGLRSLSALFGTATIAVVWMLGRRLGGERAALAAAALVAFNPMLVWFSQEARSYALLALLGALSALLWLRALERPADARRLLAWGVVAALALATHYYALFLVAPQALWLVVRAPGARERLIALALPVAAGAALLPLALAQRSNDSAAFIVDAPLPRRVAQILKQFLVGYDAPAESLLTVLTGLALAAGIAGLVALLAGAVAVPAPERADAARLAACTGAALGLALLASVAGEDHLLTRNVLALLPLAAALAGAGLAGLSHAAPRVAAAAAALACAVGLVAVIGVAGDARYQRDDWRGAARSLGAAPGGGRLLAAPTSALVPLGYYVPGLRPVDTNTLATVTTAEVDYVALPARAPGEPPAPPRPAQVAPPAPGFAIAGRTDGETFTVVRLRAPAPQPVGLEAVSIGLDGRTAMPMTAP